MPAKNNLMSWVSKDSFEVQIGSLKMLNNLEIFNTDSGPPKHASYHMGWPMLPPRKRHLFFFSCGFWFFSTTFFSCSYGSDFENFNTRKGMKQKSWKWIETSQGMKQKSWKIRETYGSGSLAVTGADVPCEVVAIGLGGNVIKELFWVIWPSLRILLWLFDEQIRHISLLSFWLLLCIHFNWVVIKFI